MRCRLNGMKAFALLLLATLVLAAGCGGGEQAATTPPTGDPDYSGQVIQVDGNSVLVRADGDACGIWARRGERIDDELWASLEAGQTVDLWVPGPIAESCPTQGTAEAVVVTAPA